MPRSLRRFPRFRKKRSQRPVPTHTPPPCKAVEVEVLGVAAGLTRFDMMPAEAVPEPTPAPPEQEELKPVAAQAAIPKAQAEPSIGHRLGRQK